MLVGLDVADELGFSVIGRVARRAVVINPKLVAEHAGASQHQLAVAVVPLVRAAALEDDRQRPVSVVGHRLVTAVERERMGVGPSRLRVEEALRAVVAVPESDDAIRLMGDASERAGDIEAVDDLIETAEVLEHFLASIVEVALLELTSADRCGSAERNDAARKDCDRTTWTAARSAR